MTSFFMINRPKIQIHLDIENFLVTVLLIFLFSSNTLA
ncbi:hypothetical protein J500_0154 [Acinetobacter sp. 479375]|nr:hypothetical protein J500_0154 [Acinetobacter sp. 479375]BBF78362.1 hypothetical protein URS_2381 [Acinetobacter ursingii]